MALAATHSLLTMDTVVEGQFQKQKKVTAALLDRAREIYEIVDDEMREAVEEAVRMPLAASDHADTRI